LNEAAPPLAPVSQIKQSTNNNITPQDKSHSRTFFAGLFLARPAATLGDILFTPAGTVVISLGACITN
jgi:hypothetical protein